MTSGQYADELVALLKETLRRELPPNASFSGSITIHVAPKMPPKFEVRYIDRVKESECEPERRA